MKNDPIIQNLDDETFQASLEARSAYLTSYEVMEKLIDKNNNIANQYYQDASNSAENAKTSINNIHFIWIFSSGKLWIFHFKFC